MDRPLFRRDFLGRTGAAVLLAAGCRTRRAGEPIILRLSHSMTAGPTSLHALGDAIRELAETATGGAVQVRLFPSGTLGQEREVAQQLQEGLVDFMVSRTASWAAWRPSFRSWTSRSCGATGTTCTASWTAASATKRQTTWKPRSASGRSRGVLRSVSAR